jgi:hypothetical protein
MAYRPGGISGPDSFDLREYGAIAPLATASGTRPNYPSEVHAFFTLRRIPVSSSLLRSELPTGSDIIISSQKVHLSWKHYFVLLSLS